MKSDLKKIIISQDDVFKQIVKKYNLDEYVLKLYKYATIFTYYNGSQLKGFIAYYSNDTLKENAFLTIIIIDKDSRGGGIGRLLLESSISDLIKKGFKNYKLEVLKGNEKAILLYEKYGFEIVNDIGESYLMNLDLNKNAK